MSGCGGDGGATAPSAPPPAETSAPSLPNTPLAVTSDVIRAGDRVTIRLSGVPDAGYINEVQIPDSGDITVPYLTQSFHAIGRNTADLADEISTAYRTDKIYTNPNVTIIPEARYVNLGGEVRAPQRVQYTPDLTLLSAINSCGGFTEYANRKSVRVLRGRQVFQVDAVQAARTPGADPPLYPGDQVTVPRTIF